MFENLDHEEYGVSLLIICFMDNYQVDFKELLSYFVMKFNQLFKSQVLFEINLNIYDLIDLI
jgi:hypothetical protein